MEDSSLSVVRLRSTDETVTEIMRIHRSLPARPRTEEVEAAMTVIENAEREEETRLETVAKQSKNSTVPEELFTVLQEMQKSMACYVCKEKKRDAVKLIDLENLHVLFDDLIQRASNCVSNCNGNNGSGSGTHNKVSSNSKDSVSNSVTVSSSSSSSGLLKKEAVKKPSETLFAKDDSYLNNKAKAKSTFYSTDGFPNAIGQKIPSKPYIVDSSLLNTSSKSGEEDGDENKMSLIKLASLIELSAKKGTRELKLQNKLMDQVDWLPDSIGKLLSLVTLDLSENRIIALPPTIGGLSSLTRLDLHSNRILELPHSVEDLTNLTYLNVGGNMLSSLPPSLGKIVKLEELHVNSNHLSFLPDSIGSLISLKVLNVETNDIEEIPHSIRRCCSLKVLIADYNRLKALPEAVGKIHSLEILSVRYNNIKQLPTTMSSLTNLKELNVSFNELEFVPESLCFATSLVKMNLGNNFADMQSLPRSIGNLEMLEELDISNNQIRFLPDSFRMLTRLCILRAEENPLEVPPRHITDKGAQAVVKYMGEIVEKRDVKSQPLKQRKGWAQICFFSKSNKRKRDAVDRVKA